MVTGCTSILPSNSRDIVPCISEGTLIAIVHYIETDLYNCSLHLGVDIVKKLVERERESLQHSTLLHMYNNNA